MADFTAVKHFLGTTPDYVEMQEVWDKKTNISALRLNYRHAGWLVYERGTHGTVGIERRLRDDEKKSVFDREREKSPLFEEVEPGREAEPPLLVDDPEHDELIFSEEQKTFISPRLQCAVPNKVVEFVR